MKLIWAITGDELPLDVCNQEFAEHWVSELNKSNSNSFSLSESMINFDCQEILYTQIKLVSNTLISKFKLNNFEQFLNLDLLEQSILNKLHHDWVLIAHSYPTLPTLLKSIDPIVFEAWNKINKILHSIENDLRFIYHIEKKDGK